MPREMLEYNIASLGGVTASAAPSISAAGYTTVTNAPDIFELENEGSNVGGALAAPVMGVPVYASGDFVVTGDPNSSDKHYYGVTVAGGVGTPWWRSTCGNFYYKDGCINKCIIPKRQKIDIFLLCFLKPKKE